MKTNALIAEFVGTLAIVFVSVGSIAANQITGGASGLVGIALAYGLSYGAMVTATRTISHGHLNPAVTIAAWIVRKIDTRNMIGYVIAQCLGAIVGSIMVRLAVPSDPLQIVNMGTPALAGGVTIPQGLVTEIVLTFFLMFVMYGSLIDGRAPNTGGLFVGLTVILDVLVGGPLTGAAMNPARHLGPALLGGGMEDAWIYWVGPIVGAVLAAVAYHNLIEPEHR